MLSFKSVANLNELNEHDLDEKEGNLAPNESVGLNIAENAPRSTVRRYWRTSEPTTPYQKVNVPKDPAAPLNNNKPGDVNQTNQTPKTKEETRDPTTKPLNVDLYILQSTVPHNITRTIEIIEEDDESAVLFDSSYEDDVFEVALPTKPTIIIESSDEDDLHIQENFSMGNVSGLTEYEDYGDVNQAEDVSHFISTKIPSILNENLDFKPSLDGKVYIAGVRHSLETLRAEMEKFYNESWGGENFDHREIQKSMPRDKSLWAIDPKDRVPSLAKRKIICNYCNRPGHRDDTCRMKPPVCYMCGSTGHSEPMCPKKICLNCGSPSQMYTNMCHNCYNWDSLRCAECGQNGHPASHCPDMWRRYHNTIDINSPLERCNQTKKHYQLFCSGCARRGHLVHNCRVSLPFSGLPINSPYVCLYRPLYQPTPDQVIAPARPYTKRKLNSSTTHETRVNKKRNLSAGDENERRKTKNPAPQRNTSVSKDTVEETIKTEPKKNYQYDNKNQGAAEKAPNFIPISSANYNKKGNMIQERGISSDTNEAELCDWFKRLMSVRPAAAALKKTRGDLIKRLHSSIASLYRKEKMSSKNLKKVVKLQKQVLFLSSV